MNNKDFYHKLREEMNELGSLKNVLKKAFTNYSKRPFLGEKIDEKYIYIDYEEFSMQVDKWAHALLSLKVNCKINIAIISNNSKEMLTTICSLINNQCTIGLISPMNSPEDWSSAISLMQAEIVIFENERLLKRFRKELEPNGIRCITFSEISHISDSDVFPILNDNIQLQHNNQIDLSDENVFIVFTSGTTGAGKAVPYTNKSILTQIIDLNINAGFENNAHSSFCVLPWCHSYALLSDVLTAIVVGRKISLSSSIAAFAKDMQLVKPTLLFTVPKLCLLIEQSFRKKFEEKGWLSKKFLSLITIVKYKEINAKLFSLKLIYASLHHFLLWLIQKKLKNSGFGNLYMLVVGGSKLSNSCELFLRSIGLPVYAGYGATEAGPVISATNPKFNKPFSVGKALETTTIEIITSGEAESFHIIGEQVGEIVVSSPSVAYNYLNSQDEVFPNPHKFKTGDIGYIDKEDYLFILGRLKSQFKLENGQYVNPEPIEIALSAINWIKNIVVVGANLPVSCIIAECNLEELKLMLETFNHDEIVINEKLELKIWSSINTYLTSIKPIHRPQKIIIFLSQFTVENGLLSYTLKPKRFNIEKMLYDTINELYHNTQSVFIYKLNS